MARDGFDCKTFYNKCNRQGSFVVLIRVQSGKIYGGYNPFGYAGRNGRWLSSTETFIFSFENDQDIYNMKISRVIDPEFSLYNTHRTLTCFFNFGYALSIIGSNLCVYDNVAYNGLNVNATLPIEEIEVFSVVKK
jgi:hypothetical protein